MRNAIVMSHHKMKLQNVVYKLVAGKLMPDALENCHTVIVRVFACQFPFRGVFFQELVNRKLEALSNL